MRSSKPIPNNTNPSWEFPDDDKTKIFFLRHDKISGKQVFKSTFSGVRSLENFTIDAARVVESILESFDFSLIRLENYSLITF